MRCTASDIRHSLEENTRINLAHEPTRTVDATGLITLRIIWNRFGHVRHCVRVLCFPGLCPEEPFAGGCM